MGGVEGEDGASEEVRLDLLRACGPSCVDSAPPTCPDLSSNITICLRPRRPTQRPFPSLAHRAREEEGGVDFGKGNGEADTPQ